MKKALTTAGLIGLIAVGATLNTAGASASTVGASAKAYCNKERNDLQDFKRQYGGTGKAAMQRCVKRETRLAKRECRAELRNDRPDYIKQFGGTDRNAFQRCLKYELRS